ncbi:hypothetical protein V6N13_145028 [Hibiscus sabdariffa]|uniref:PB1 domain-containing protein n=1 Tax=Hibiscus sabdariffa TaxID=183260 RepID=A0ABR1ZUH3_9ROSI
MGKPTGKKKFQETGKNIMESNKQKKGSAADRASAKPFDNDMAIFINMSQELKEEGNRLFLKRDHEGAMLKYEKALNLLPKSHIDVAYLRTNMAACYMHLGIGEYPRAINECDLALEVSPKYSKALLRRARCYEAVNRLDLAYKDVYNVLTIEPSNSSALEVLDSVKKAMDEKGITVNENELGLFENELSGASRWRKVVNEKLKKKRNEINKKTADNLTEEKAAEINKKTADNLAEEKAVQINKETAANLTEKKAVQINLTEEKAVEDKAVVEEKVSLANEVKNGDVVTKTAEQEMKAVVEEKVSLANEVKNGEIVPKTVEQEKKAVEEEKATRTTRKDGEFVMMKTVGHEKKAVEEEKPKRLRKVVNEVKDGEFVMMKTVGHEKKAVEEEKPKRLRKVVNEVKDGEVVMKTVGEEKPKRMRKVVNEFGEIVMKTIGQDKKALEEEKGTRVRKAVHEKLKKKKKRSEGKSVEINKKSADNVTEDKAVEDKAVVEEKVSLATEVKNGDVVTKTTEQEKKAVVEEMVSLTNEVKNGEVVMKTTEREMKAVVEENEVINGEVVMKTTEQEMKAIVEKISLANEVKNGEVFMKTAEQEKKAVEEDNAISKTVKLVLGDDIRWAQLPAKCTIDLLRDIIRDRFPGLQSVTVKYLDPEGDLVTLASTDDLRFAESVAGVSGGSLRFYVVRVSPDRGPGCEGVSKEDVVKSEEKLNDVENREVIKGTCIEDWIVQFALLFKNHVGFDSDSCLDLHELGMKLYSEAMTDVVTSEDAQELFEIAADKFQEMAALALFNWGNVHMSRARKHVSLTEDGSRESMLAQVKIANEWAQKEYVLAAKRYEEAVKIKPDFHEGLLALGQQQFEQAKLCWYHAMACEIDFESGPSEEVLQLYNKAEDSMEKGMQIWEETEERRRNGLSKFDKYRTQLQKMGLDGLFKDASPEEVAEQTANMSSQIHLLWGALLYERSVVEYKIGLPTWDECLEVAVEKFGLAGASRTDLAVMIKNHCSNQNTSEGHNCFVWLLVCCHAIAAKNKSLSTVSLILKGAGAAACD